MKTNELAKVNNVAIQMVADKGQKLVPIKPICEALGINFKNQFDKLKDDDFLSSVVVLSTTTGSDKKLYEMTCLPLEFVFGWLFTINPKNVKEEAREAVAKYRIECYRVLYRYFSEQSLFLEEKNQLVSERIDDYENIRTDFKTAEKRLKLAKVSLYKAKDFTYEDWRMQKSQAMIEFTVIEEQ